VVAARGLTQVTDTAAIDEAIEAVVASNPDKVAELQTKPKLAGWFVGQVMKRTGGKANPQVVNERLRGRLGITDEG
jgi:aspartyl-tRNA(Asn)/glutamyl-tRNA(Gln) amidotransferase subunit B